MWERQIEEIRKRKSLAYQLGGEQTVKEQHAKGKLTIRERINLLLDEGSFAETGVMAGQGEYSKEGDLVRMTPCPIVMGMGEIEGRTVVLHGDDFTIKGASVGRLYKSKLAYIAKVAHELRLPTIRLLDGAGGTIKEIAQVGFTELPMISDVAVGQLAALLSMAPVVSVGLGPVSGSGAMLMVQSHFSIMVKEKSQVFVGGPPLVKWALGKAVSKEALGGYKLHTRISGVVDNEAESEEDALDQVRRFLDYMPRNVWEMPERKYAEKDDPSRREEDLLSIVPENYSKPYRMRRIMECIFDRGAIFEIGRYQGQSQITALARLDGYPVGVLANDPRVKAGAFDWDVAEKFQRFVDMCDTFHLPMVNLVDQPGFLIGEKSERYGTIRKGVRAGISVLQATIPWATLYVRRCFGVAGGSQSDPAKLNWRYAWPSAYWGNIPVEGGVYAAHRMEIESSDNPDARHRELLEYYRAFSSPFRSAENFGIEDIIDPRDSRPLLCKWIKNAYPVEQTRLGPKSRGMRC